MFVDIFKITLLCATLCFAQQLRGLAYNPYGTLGAPLTIADILQKPNDIYGQKFIYAYPALGSGYSAFDLAGGSTLLAFDNSLILGYAKSFYGLLLRISPYMYCDRNFDDSYECSSRNIFDMNFSVPLGSSILYAHTGLMANKGDDYGKYESYTKEASIGITGGNRLVWDSRINLEHREESYSGYEFVTSENLTRTEFLFNFGYKILQSDRLKFIIGLNNMLSCNYYYWSSSYIDNYVLFANISPNFLGEVALTEHLLAFVGASYHISYHMFLSKDDSTQIETFAITNSEPGAYVGLRYEYKNWAVETLLTSDAFGDLLNRNNPFFSLGLFFFFQP